MTDKKFDYLIPDIGYFMFRKCTPTWEIAASNIPFWDITYVINGSAKYTINGVKRELVKGDLLCIPSGSHRMAMSSPENIMNCYSVNFQLADIVGLPQTLPFPLISNIGIRSDLLALFSELSAVWVRKEMGYVMRSRGLFLLILHRLFEMIVYKTDSGAMDPRVKAAIKYISENYLENITVKELASISGLNPVYFGALFKETTGILAKQYITQTRINHAEDMLRNGECSISEAAERCGYNDISLFRKRFKSIKGFPPSQCI